MEYYIGLIALLPYNFSPMGWYLCNGMTLQISQNSALFSLIGTTYGGDGMTTFTIPNMLGLEPVPGMNYYICAYGLYPTRP